MMRRLYSVLKVAVAFAAVVWLVRSGRLEFGTLRSAMGTFHLLGIATVLASMLVQAVRWQLLLRTQGVELSLRRVVQLSWIAHFFSLSVLGAWGAEAVRAYYIAGEVPEMKGFGVFSVIVDRVLGICALLCVSGIAFGIFASRHSVSRDLMWAGTFSMAMFAVALVGGGVLWHPATRARALALLPRRGSAFMESTVQRWRAEPSGILECFVLALIGGVMLVAAFVIAGRLVGAQLGCLEALAAGPLVLLAGNVPISPAGIGVAEAAAAALFGKFGIETGAAIMVIVRCWLVLSRLPGGIVYAFAAHRRKVGEQS